MRSDQIETGACRYLTLRAILANRNLLCIMTYDNIKEISCVKTEDVNNRRWCNLVT